MSVLSNVTIFLPILSVIISIFLVVGGYVAFRHGYNQMSAEIQERVINALKNEVEILENKVDACEKENLRLRQIVATVRNALKRRGLYIEIDGDEITLIDEQSKRTSTIPIRLVKGADDDDDDETPPPIDTKRKTQK